MVSCQWAPHKAAQAIPNEPPTVLDSLAPGEYAYYRREYSIPMRDGICLFTTVYTPRDTTVPHPMVIRRTPYGCYSYGDDPHTVLGSAGASGYIFVEQDVRGRNMSEGQFEHVRPYIPLKSPGETDEASDAYDTIEWLLRNVDGHNGRVAVSGVSYDGFYALMAALSEHPALKIVIPEAPVTDWFMGDDVHHNGALALMDVYGFFPLFDAPREKIAPSQKNPYWTHSGYAAYRKDSLNQYEYFLKTGSLDSLTQILRRNRSDRTWVDIVLHPNYDWFWQERDMRRYVRDVKPAVLIVGGLLDAEDLYGSVSLYQTLLTHSYQTDTRLLLGPWGHGGWYDASNPEHKVYEDRIAALLAYYLEDRGKIDSIPKADVYFMGASAWHKFDAWPPENVVPTKYYLRNNGRLDTLPPRHAEGKTSYVSDPASPVPYTASARMDHAYMNEDQRFVESRPDVLTFCSEALTTPVTIAGQVKVGLQVSLTGQDADFIVKLIDLDLRDSTQRLVRGEIMRGRFRNSFLHPEPFVPEALDKVAFSLPDVAYTWGIGHCIEVQVQSSWFPLFDRNPQTWVENIYMAKPTDYKACTIHIWHQEDAQSYIEVPYVCLGGLQ